MGAEVVATPFGKFQVWPQDLIGSTTKAGTLWDGGMLQPVAREYGHLGEPFTTILDVGANIGTFSVWLASRGAWRVVAVEPHPQIMLMLKANLDLNQATCGEVVIPLEIAAWSKETCVRQGRADPLPTDGNIGSHYVVETPAGDIPAAPLDSYRWLYGDRVSLVKIDVEGSEWPVLQGLEQTLTRDHPAVVFECLPPEATYQKEGAKVSTIAHWFAGRRYQVWEWPSLPHNYLARWLGD